MSAYIPGIIYENVKIMLTKYRGYEITSPVLTPGQLTERFNHFEHVVISCVRKEHILGPSMLTCIIISPGSKYSDKSADFKKLINPHLKDGGPGILIVSSAELSPFITKFIADEPRIEARLYKHFASVKPESDSVPHHQIATEEEVVEYCNTFYADRKKFPKINSHDVMGIWMGIRPGMTMRIDRVSETGGIAVVYRYCKG